MRLYSFVRGLLLIIYSVEASIKFYDEIPSLVHQNTPYLLRIKNNDLSEKFPFENFVLSFELLQPNNQETLGIAAVTSSDFKGDDFRGFSLTDFLVNKESIELKITFRKEAHNHKLVIRYSSEKTEQEKQLFFDDKLKGIIFECNIKMYLPCTITMQAMPDMGVILEYDKGEFEFQLIPDRYGLITCKATNGLEDITPMFINGDILKGSIMKVINSGLKTLQWKVSATDHEKVIQCKASDTVHNITLFVYHYMTDVETRPLIDTKISGNSQVKCVNKDGYPSAKTMWSFISGPPEALKFYQLQDNETTLYINESAPTNYNWSFECRGMNNIPEIVEKYLNHSFTNFPIKKIYNFSIIDSSEPVQQSKVGSALVICIIFIILFIVVMGFCFAKRLDIQKYFNQYTRVFKSESENKKSAKTSIKNSDSYQYNSEKNDFQENGPESNYSHIVAYVQKKPDLEV